MTEPFWTFRDYTAPEKTESPVRFFLLQECVTDGKGECQQEECLAAARRVSAAMAWGRDPCQDFYQFACGSVAGRTSSEGVEADGSFVALQEVVTRNIQRKSPSTPSGPCLVNCGPLERPLYYLLQVSHSTPAKQISPPPLMAILF